MSELFNEQLFEKYEDNEKIVKGTELLFKRINFVRIMDNLIEDCQNRMLTKRLYTAK